METNTLRLGDTGPDVATLQRRLNARGPQYNIRLNVDHVFGLATDAAVRTFQRANGLVVDGIAGPRTQRLLLGVAPASIALTQADIEAAAVTLQCDVAAIQAVISVESPKGGFLPDGRVVILFERHVMARKLKAAGIDPAPYQAAQPNIVNTQPGGYLGGAAEYSRLAAAKQIDATAALCSASWGRFQVMGYHYAALGYATVQAFVADMATGEAAQLRAFVKFVLADTALHAALQARDWPAFARGYNGPNYAINHYDARLTQAYLSVPTTNADYAAADVAPPDTHTTPEAEQVAAAVSASDAEQPATDVGGTGRRGKRKANATPEATA